MAEPFKRAGSRHWYIIYDLPPGPDGKRRQKMQSCPGMTKPEARLELARIQTEISRGTFVEPSTLTVAEHLTHWLERKSTFEGRSPSTVAGYSVNIDRHITPYLGKHLLTKLTPSHIQRFYDRLHDSGLSNKTIKNIHGILRCALNQAVKQDVLVKNPADKVDVPRVDRPRITIATEIDLMKLYVAIDESPYRIPIRLALATGARRGEVLALKWSDFDADRGLLTIQRAVVQVKGNVVYKGTKSGNVRVLQLGPTIIAELVEHQTAQAERLNVIGIRDTYGDWICTDFHGKAQTPSGLGTAYYRLKKSTGIEVTLHGLRHTWVTEQLAAGVASETVQKASGHATMAFMHDRYGHAQARHQQATVDVSERLLNTKPTISIAK